MPWVRRTADPSRHDCRPPVREVVRPHPECDIDGAPILWPEQREQVPDGHLTDLWRCGDCPRLWRIAPACDWCDVYGGIPHPGRHAVGLTWRRATFWQHFIYGRRR